MTVRFGNHRIAFYSKPRLVDHRCNRTSSQHLSSWGFYIIRYCQQCDDIRISQTDFRISGVVLGLSANFASIFFPKFHRKCLLDCAPRRTTKLRFLDDFIIFALITPSLTIFTFLLTSVKPLQNLDHVVLTCFF